MVGHKIGYTRVSSVYPKMKRQLEGVALDKVFSESVSIKYRKRPVLAECLDYLRKGDELHIQSLDRLARNVVELHRIIGDMIAKGVSIHFHQEGLIFSGVETPANAIKLQMVGAFADFEKNLLHERQAEGIADAKKRGVKFGKAPKLTPEQIEKIKEMVENRYSKTEIAQKFKVTRQTIYNVLK